MQDYIILLRGVMPVGKNKVPMKALCYALERAGLQEVKTYIQTGNVIASSNLSQENIKDLVHYIIQKEIGANIAVMVRTQLEFEKLLKQCPIQNEALQKANPQRLYFSIWETVPETTLIKELEKTNFFPDQVTVGKEAIYTLYATKYSDSKFTNPFFERKLKVAITTRNYNTMSALWKLSTKS